MEATEYRRLTADVEIKGDIKIKTIVGIGLLILMIVVGWLFSQSHTSNQKKCLSLLFAVLAICGVPLGGTVFLLIAFVLLVNAFSSPLQVRNTATEKRSDYLDSSHPDALRVIWNNYIDQWPDNNIRYQCWKPVSLLPAPRSAVKRAMKMVYAELPEPIDYTVYSAFYMEFADLALHLPDEKFAKIEKFRKSRVKCCGKETNEDPLLTYMCHLLPTNASMYRIEDLTKYITDAKEGFKRSITWDPIDVDDNDLETVHQIVVESTVDFATLIQEWRSYIQSIGRDQ